MIHSITITILLSTLTNALPQGQNTPDPWTITYLSSRGPDPVAQSEHPDWNFDNTNSVNFCLAYAGTGRTSREKEGWRLKKWVKAGLTFAKYSWIPPNKPIEYVPCQDSNVAVKFPVGEYTTSEEFTLLIRVTSPVAVTSYGIKRYASQGSAGAEDGVLTCQRGSLGQGRSCTGSVTYVTPRTTAP
ncbi:MAG: hypothetical protein M1835_001310 [Candelina submexicana]|nr:MAG: hypothetical protein M1835_001310 [Candelina submexicana]